MQQYGNRWSFYHCEALRVVLFYCDSRPVVAPVREQTEVWCPALGRQVRIKLIGVGQAGHDAFLALRHSGQLDIDRFLPVNLFATPHVLDPQPSRRCDPADSREFFDLCQTVLAEEMVESRHPVEEY